MANTKETMQFLKVFFYLSALNGHSLLLFLTLQNFYFYIMVSNLGFMVFLCVCLHLYVFLVLLIWFSFFICLFVCFVLFLLVLILYVIIITFIYQYMPVYILMGENEGCGRHG